MSYLKLPLVGALLDGLLPAEKLVVLLDTGQTVAVQITVSRDPVTFEQLYHLKARQISGSGETVLDPNGAPIYCETRTTIKADIVAGAGDNVVLAQLAKLALGEPVTAFGWSAEFRRDVSIRTAIATAARMGVITNLGSLL